MLENNFSTSFIYLYSTLSQKRFYMANGFSVCSSTETPFSYYLNYRGMESLPAQKFSDTDIFLVTSAVHTCSQWYLNILLYTI